jgi:predicted outer membrane repeat protein
MKSAERFHGMAIRPGWPVLAWAWLALLPGLAAARTLHVDAGSPRPQPPYATLATAAHTIQEAVAAAADGDVVRVQPGRYDQGGAVRDGQWNRVVVDKAITVRSAGGAEITVIAGARDPAAPPELRGCGPQAVRGVYLAHPQARLVGFRIAGGATLAPAGIDEPWDRTGRQGGGVYAAAPSAVIRHCILDGNAAGLMGGGLYGGTAVDCTLSANWAPWGGGAAEADLTGCQLVHNAAHYGGGAHGGTLRRCDIRDNIADCECEDPDSYGGGVFAARVYDSTLHHNLAITSGGGACGSELWNCILSNNSAGDGGGAAYSTLHRCILTGNRANEEGGGSSNSSSFDSIFRGNRADSGGGGCADGRHVNALIVENETSWSGGGAYNARLVNCTVARNQARLTAGGTYDCRHVNTIVYENRADGDPATANWSRWVYPPWYVPTNSIFSHSCTTPLPAGEGNTDAHPGFDVRDYYDWIHWNNFRLTADSPCIDAGSSALVTNAPAADLDGRPRVSGAAIDIGAYEHPAPALVAGALYVDPAQAHSPVQDGSRQHPCATIQAGIDAAAPGATVVLRSGIYRGPGNQNLSFRGKPLTVQAETNRHATGVVIDCEGAGRGFVFDQDETESSILRGLVIRNGLATNGGAIFCAGASPLIENCTFDKNTAHGFGGAVYAEGARGPRLVNCRVERNSARIVWQANYWGGQGAGLYSRTEAPARIEDSTVERNTGESTGHTPVCGAIQGAWDVVRCTVAWHTNAAMVGIRDAARVEDCEISYNACGVRDAALLLNSRIQHNRGAGVCFSLPGTAARCRIERNAGPGVQILPSSTGTVHVAASEILCNLAAAAGGANLQLHLADCRISGNGSGSSAGMGYVGHARCTIADNGSVGTVGYGALDYSSCLIRGNRGPAFTAVKGGIRLDHCTLVDNGPNRTNGPTLFQGGYNGWLQIRNSIVWNNGDHLFAHDGYLPSAVFGFYSLIQHSATLYPFGQGCLDTDPQFVSGTDFRLRPGSPALGAGHPVFAPAGGDLEGHPWTTPPALGAYALPGPAAPAGLAIQALQSPAAVRLAGGDAHGPARISWEAVAGCTYALWRSTNLLEGFQPAFTFASPAAGPVTHDLTEPDPAPPQVFYQLRASPAP